MAKVAIEIQETNPIKQSKATGALQTIASNLDAGMLEKLATVAKSEKGKSLFKSKWMLIKSLI